MTAAAQRSRLLLGPARQSRGPAPPPREDAEATSVACSGLTRCKESVSSSQAQPLSGTHLGHTVCGLIKRESKPDLRLDSQDAQK